MKVSNYKWLAKHFTISEIRTVHVNYPHIRSAYQQFKNSLTVKLGVVLLQKMPQYPSV